MADFDFGTGGGAVGGGTLGSAATAYSMILQAINTASVDGGYKIAEQQGVFAELARLLDPSLSISSAKISEAFDKATDANSLASSSVFRDLVNGNTYLDDLGRASAELFQYYGGYDLANLSAAPVSSFTPSSGAGPQGVWVSQDETRIVWVSSQDDRVRSGVMSTPGDPSTIVEDAGTLYVGSQEPVPQDVFMKPDGTRVFVAGTNQRSVRQYTLSTPWDLSTATYDGTGLYANERSVGIWISDNGSIAFTTTQEDDFVRSWALGTAWDITSNVTPSQTFNPGIDIDIISSVHFADANTMYLGDRGSADGVRKYSLSSGFNLATATLEASAPITSGANSVRVAGGRVYTVNGSGINLYTIAPTELQAPA